MKQVRSKSLETQRKVIETAIVRVGKTRSSMQELSYRNWKGAEMPFVAPVKEVTEALVEALEAMRKAERHMAGLVSMAEQRGK